jgi:hypothetical protein
VEMIHLPLGWSQDKYEGNPYFWIHTFSFWKPQHMCYINQCSICGQLKGETHAPLTHLLFHVSKKNSWPCSVPGISLTLSITHIGPPRMEDGSRPTSWKLHP